MCWPFVFLLFYPGKGGGYHTSKHVIKNLEHGVAFADGVGNGRSKMMKGYKTSFIREK